MTKPPYEKTVAYLIEMLQTFKRTRIPDDPLLKAQYERDLTETESTLWAALLHHRCVLWQGQVWYVILPPRTERVCSMPGGQSADTLEWPPPVLEPTTTPQKVAGILPRKEVENS